MPDRNRAGAVAAPTHLVRDDDVDDAELHAVGTKCEADRDGGGVAIVGNEFSSAAATGRFGIKRELGNKFSGTAFEVEPEARTDTSGKYIAQYQRANPSVVDLGKWIFGAVGLRYRADELRESRDQCPQLGAGNLFLQAVKQSAVAITSR